MSAGDAATDDGNAFVGTEAAAAHLERIMARPGMAGRVAEVRAQMHAADDADVDPDRGTC